MNTAEVDGARIAFADEGSGSPAFVFVHGLACDSSAWQPQFDALKGDYRCISVDLRGRGHSSHALPCDPETAANDVAAVVRQAGCGPAIVVGHSLGGLVGLLLNESHPDLVLGIVLGDSPVRAELGGHFDRTVDALREAGSTEPLRRLVDSFFVETTAEALRVRIGAMMLECPPDIAAGMLDNCQDLASRAADLVRAADRKPFMAIWAGKPIGDPAWLRDKTMFLRQEPIPGTGHFFQLEEPAITTALLRAFVDDVRRDPRLPAQGFNPS